METQYRRGTVDRAIGITSLAVAAVAALCVVLPVPWQLRLVAVSIAGLLGPGVPGLRFLIEMDVLPSVIIGAGLDVALLMVVGQLMLLVHLWEPEAVFIILLVATFASGAGLVLRAREVREPG